MSTAATPRTEREPIRPFTGLGPSKEALRLVTMQVDDEVKAPGSIPLSASALDSAKFSLTLPDVEVVKQLVDQTPVPVVDCGLVVMVASHMHRGAAEVLIQQYLGRATYPTDYEFTRAVKDLALMDTTGFTVTVALVLLNDLQPQPLCPYMAGTWLARQVFDVTLERDSTSFSPEPLTEDVRVRNGLRKGVTRFIEVDPLLSAQNLADAVRLYVDPDVLSWLHAQENTPAAKQVMVELAIQTYVVAATAFIEDIRSDLARKEPPSATDLETYPVAKELFDYLAELLSEKDHEVTVSDVISYATRAGVLAAHLDVVFGMRDETMRALKENQ